jgi:ADP-ribose pyrophosphatase YjhB (NUDIX family)
MVHRHPGDLVVTSSKFAAPLIGSDPRLPAAQFVAAGAVRYKLAPMGPLPARFCDQCGAALIRTRPNQAGQVRSICSHCGTIAYDNPRVLVTTIVVCAARVLLCRRASAPAAGRWTLPGGFMESGETLEAAAARETSEETGVSVNPQALRFYGVAAIPEISEIYIGFLAEILDEPMLTCGPECTDAGFFSETDLPWAELAYPEIAYYLRVYFAERSSNQDVIHVGSLENDVATDRSYHIAVAKASKRPRHTS